jgi:hypothetical protein
VKGSSNERLRITALMLLAVALIIFMDLSYNYFNAMFTDCMMVILVVFSGEFYIEIITGH